jgi:tetratricopeptide (TPR) repeat protein
VALPEFEAAEHFRAMAAPDDIVWLVRVRTDLAWCYVRLRRSAEAVQVLTELMGPAYTPRRVGAVDWTKIHLQYSLALMSLSRFDEAVRTLRDTIDQVGRTLGPNHYASGVAWNHLTAIYVEAGDWGHALEAGKQAHRILRDSAGASGQAALSAFGDLGVITFLSGKVADALPMLKDAHATLAEVTGEASPLTQYVRFYLASALTETSALEEAETLASSLSAEALASTYPADDWQARLEGLRGRILLRRGRIEEARSSLQMAVAQLTRSGAQPWVVKPLSRALDEATPPRKLAR